MAVRAAVAYRRRAVASSPSRSASSVAGYFIARIVEDDTDTMRLLRERVLPVLPPAER
jgi:hypothetical protein